MKMNRFEGRLTVFFFITEIEETYMGSLAGGADLLQGQGVFPGWYIFYSFLMNQKLGYRA